MARNLDQVVHEKFGVDALTIARLTVINEEQADKIAAIEAELAKLKASKTDG